MKRGVHYDKVYSPVSVWSSIRILLILVALEGWKTIQVYYVQAFPQTSIDKELYPKVPACFQVEYGDKYEYALKIHINIYGQKQAERV